MTPTDKRKMTELHDQWILEECTKAGGLPTLDSIIALVKASLGRLEEIRNRPEHEQIQRLLDHNMLSTASNRLDMLVEGTIHQQNIVNQTLDRMEDKGSAM